MLTNPPPVYRKRNEFLKSAVALPPVATGPVLVGAVYNVATSVVLQFDRAIDIGAIEVVAFRVYDGDDNQMGYRGVASELVNETTVAITLSEQDAWTTPGVTLTALPTNGIAASDDGAAWTGVSDLVLPFP